MTTASAEWQAMGCPAKPFGGGSLTIPLILSLQDLLTPSTTHSAWQLSAVDGGGGGGGGGVCGGRRGNWRGRALRRGARRRALWRCAPRGCGPRRRRRWGVGDPAAEVEFLAAIRLLVCGPLVEPVL